LQQDHAVGKMGADPPRPTLWPGEAIILEKGDDFRSPGLEVSDVQLELLFQTSFKPYKPFEHEGKPPSPRLRSQGKTLAPGGAFLRT
jgi:hypothetical protein